MTTDRIRAVNQRWLATMGLDDESLELRAEIRRRADALREQHGVEERVIRGMQAELGGDGGTP